MWLEVQIQTSGKPVDNGFNCNFLNKVEKATWKQNIHRLDFVFKQDKPRDTDNQSPAYVIGDMKISVSAALDRAKRGNQGKEHNGMRWLTMLNFISTYLLLFTQLFMGEQNPVCSLKLVLMST
ncbi:hypothetical protein C7H19_22325 [Aphanothece hegewaldii CCALA 016]|uniref:Uncharacterized protein n=1 Tax=Aphanothece hegewaldii CCALA 016 TaxID=2107694 RepID=A0A2T1LRW0_9CHRO|nr:hypothetical protein [Aphanothece hegewaldii]PSF31764.1 hypothetical protein C7H19_22325 [Aphanothece hegewaldii CCALA 016]